MNRSVRAALAALIALALTAVAAWFIFRTPGSVLTGGVPVVPAAPSRDKPVVISVQKGESATDIGDALAASGVVRSSRLFQVLVAITGVQDSLEAGEYEFEPGVPAVEVVRRIAEGKTASHEVTIPEGLRAEQVGALLEKNNIVKAQDFLAALHRGAYNLPFLAQLPDDNLEGYIFPASYAFSPGENAGQVVRAMLQAFQDNVADKVQLEGQQMTLAQVVTLASIVEREAATPSERPIIASVYLNRLRAGMPLQADPTVQFAVAADAGSVAQFGWWKADLTVGDLKIESPYNTYVTAGLPPGPIANPGLASIEAVVRPAQTDYLFFVAKGDGTHVFAKTLEEQEANVRKYEGGTGQ